jgi:hypothetical protein
MIRRCKVFCKRRLANRKSLMEKIKAEILCSRKLLTVNFNKSSSFNIVSWTSQST